MKKEELVFFPECLKELVKLGYDHLFEARSELITQAHYAYYTQKSKRPFLLDRFGKHIGRSIDSNLEKTKTKLGTRVLLD